MKATDASSNTNHLWQFNNAMCLWLEVKSFLEDVLKQNESSENKIKEKSIKRNYIRLFG